MISSGTSSVRLFDITPPIRVGMPVWPGDTPPEREVLLDIARGDAVTLSTLRSTVHLGAHADAPAHYGLAGRTIERQPLEVYLGPCQVIDASATRGRLIGEADLSAEPRSRRVLIRTGHGSIDGEFPRDFAAISPSLVDLLASQGVVLLGVDTPSVDPFESKDLPAHRRLFLHDVAILEGLRLDGIAAGDYELIALPLPLVGFDGSPVRAVLRTLQGAASDGR